MKVNLMEREEKASVIYTARHRVAGQMAEYRLLKEEELFLLELAYGEECVRVEASDDFACAASLFEALRRGCVTPCTARDVVRDLLLSKTL